VSSADEYYSWDAAYVLGSLSTVDRQAFERHLAGCEECRRSLQSLAGLPGLLAPSRDHVLRSASEPADPVPDTLLPALLADVGRDRRRRRWLTTAGTAVAAASLAILGTLAVQARDNPVPPPTAAVTQLSLAPLVNSPMTASVDLTRKRWGTSMTIHCTYEAGSWGEPTYALVVTDRTGVRQQAASWIGLPGTSATVQASTSYHPEDISSVEVTVAGGQSVLEGKP
jgi:hypothetical protein